MNDQERECLIQVFCGICALFFVILIMRELDKNHRWEPHNTPPTIDNDYAPGEEQRILERDKSTVHDAAGIKAN